MTAPQSPTGPTMPFPPAEPLFWWWLQMILCSVLVVVLFAVVWHRTRGYVSGAYAARHAWSHRYCMWMRLLAIPYVFECVWRSWLPSQYNERVTIVDNGASSVLLERMLAAVGESCWGIQFSWALRVIAQNVPLKAGPRARFVVRNVVPWVTYITSVLPSIAQLFSIAGMVSTNFYFNVWEESLWACVFILIGFGSSVTWFFCADDACAALFQECRYEVAVLEGEEERTKSHHHDDASIWVMRLFVRALALFGLGCAVYTCAHDVPYWHSKWLGDQASNKTYLAASQGFYDAAFTQRANQTVEAWSDQFFWMSGYFLFGPLSAIILMYSPGRVRWESCDCALHEHGLIQF